ncbi:hypothetical protein HDU67_006619 [Dinochytrium kinnereticum]|nr:hypothetical protein HDU67_006619 [Dinochytrium kinnereticum]
MLSTLFQVLVHLAASVLDITRLVFSDLLPVLLEGFGELVANVGVLVTALGLEVAAALSGVSQTVLYHASIVFEAACEALVTFGDGAADTLGRSLGVYDVLKNVTGAGQAVVDAVAGVDGSRSMLFDSALFDIPVLALLCDWALIFGGRLLDVGFDLWVYLGVVYECVFGSTPVILIVMQFVLALGAVFGWAIALCFGYVWMENYQARKNGQESLYVQEQCHSCPLCGSTRLSDDEDV